MNEMGSAAGPEMNLLVQLRLCSISSGRVVEVGLVIVIFSSEECAGGTDLTPFWLPKS